MSNTAKSISLSVRAAEPLTKEQNLELEGGGVKGSWILKGRESSLELPRLSFDSGFSRGSFLMFSQGVFFSSPSPRSH